MKFENLIYEKRDRIGFITMNKPESYNSYDPVMAEELYRVFQIVKWDRDIRAVILKAEGKAFSAGGDIRSFKKAIDAGNFTKMVEDLTLTLNGTLLLIKKMEKIVISYVDGIVAGVGLSFALNTDVSFATEDSVFIGGYNALATTPDGGSSFPFVKKAGIPKSLYFFLSNEKFSAKELERWGLISKVVDKDKGFEYVMDFANKVANGPQKAISLTKKLFYTGLSLSFEEYIEMERDGIIACSQTDDMREAVNAFVEKRKPEFK